MDASTAIWLMQIMDELVDSNEKTRLVMECLEAHLPEYFEKKYSEKTLLIPILLPFLRLSYFLLPYISKMYRIHRLVYCKVCVFAIYCFNFCNICF